MTTFLWWLLAVFSICRVITAITHTLVQHGDRRKLLMLDVIPTLFKTNTEIIDETILIYHLALMW